MGKEFLQKLPESSQNVYEAFQLSESALNWNMLEGYPVYKSKEKSIGG